MSALHKILYRSWEIFHSPTDSQHKLCQIFDFLHFLGLCTHLANASMIWVASVYYYYQDSCAFLTIWNLANTFCCCPEGDEPQHINLHVLAAPGDKVSKAGRWFLVNPVTLNSPNTCTIVEVNLICSIWKCTIFLRKHLCLLWWVWWPEYAELYI